ncbi:MAG: hypothetical protein CL878_10695 [Dehalococcoidia bacterium]|nr:hypothetical protein [Dehalococcoidia bacterium]
MRTVCSRRRALQVAGAALASGAAVAVGAPLAGAADRAQPGVYFPETGQTVALDFAQFWLDSGGQRLFGLPITPEYDEEGIGVQWFERARFERWPDQPDIVLPLLADEYLVAIGDSSAIQPDPAPSGSGQHFPETGFTVHEPFLSFFHLNGGAAIFGYPISQRHLMGDAPVQYFQRARLEQRKQGVHIGRIGVDVARSQGWPLGPSPRGPGAVNWQQVAADRQWPDWDTSFSTHGDAVFDMELRIADFDDDDTWRQLRWVAVSLGHQRATAFVGDQPVFTDLVSTGSAEKGFTPLGLHTIEYRVYNELMDGAAIGLSKDDPLYYRLENVLYTQYFNDRGHAIHYAWWHDDFGTPMSFGCVNMRLPTARFFWRWARIGTPILIHK